MQILGGDIVHILRCGYSGSVQVGCASWLACGNRDEVESCRTAFGHFDCHLILGREPHDISVKIGLVTLIVLGRYRYVYLAQPFAVKADVGSRGGSSRKRHRDTSTHIGHGGIDGVAFLRSATYGHILEEVSSTWIPREIVHFVQTVIVVSRGVKSV